MTRNRQAAGIYVHVPFCRQKCIYCDFPSRGGCGTDEILSYFTALYRELEQLNRFLQEPQEETTVGMPSLREVLPADTVFIGGGTPSVVPPACIEGVLERLPVQAGAEITLEANPGTLDLAKLQRYRAAGVNRLSLGVQSFQDAELAWLGRIHDADTARQAVHLARQAGFDNLNLDLLFGLPGQTMAAWEETLRAAIALEPEHLSFYSLQVEEGTPLYDMVRADQVEPLPDEVNRAMYHRALHLLAEAGYERYEISNAARPGRACRHNRKYWSMAPYLGVGAAAHSYLAGGRYSNPADSRTYERLMEQPAASLASYLHARDFTPNTREDEITDFLFTGLRLAEGVSLEEFQARFGEDLLARRGEAIQRFLRQGELALEDGRLFFTERGLDITNYILMELF